MQLSFPCATGSPDLFAGQWDAGLPGGLAAARRPGLCINAVFPPGADGLAASQEGQAQLAAATRALLLTQFVSTGVPCLPASTLATPDMVRFVGLLAELRRSYRDLLSQAARDSARGMQWHAATPGKYLGNAVACHVGQCRAPSALQGPK